MGDYIKLKLQEISIDKSREKHKEASVTEGERSQLRGVVQSLMWLATREARHHGPDSPARDEDDRRIR